MRFCATALVALLSAFSFPANAESGYVSKVIANNFGDAVPALPYRNLSAVLGPPDYNGVPSCEKACSFLSLGANGSITVEMDTSDLPEHVSIEVFEVGPAKENVRVETSSDGSSWVEPKSLRRLPIAQVRFLRITDKNNRSGGATVGADIDAVQLHPSVDAPLSNKMIAWAQSISATMRPQPPGNSIEAINFAYSLGYDGVEMDIQATKDRTVILFHDPDVDHILKKHGRVSSFTYGDLLKESLGQWQGKPVRIPTLADALKANGNRGSFLIDCRVDVSFAKEIAQAIEDAKFDKSLLRLNAYNVEAAKALKAALPGVAIYAKTYETPQTVSMQWVASVAASGLDGIELWVKENNGPLKDFVDAVHALNLRVITFVHYNGQPISDLENLIHADVDDILTQNHEMWKEIEEQAGTSTL